MGKVLFSTLALLIVFSSIGLYYYTHPREEHVKICGGQRGEKYYGLLDDDNKKVILKFDLVDPECAPEAMLAKILYGYHMMIDTRKHAPDYAKNGLDCNNCHFGAGNTLGGKNRGISLVGVAAAYPRFSKRDNKKISLSDRINNCFRRSLNGNPLPPGSYEMEALIAYMGWISHEVMDSPTLPWLGLDDIDSKHKPNAKKGEHVYDNKCAICHGATGAGNIKIPPLWGDMSYNDGAGMNTLKMLSSFVWQNMPYGQPTLTQEEALDVAAFLITKPRPHFVP